MHLWGRRERGRETGCGWQEPVPDWQVDQEEGGVVYGVGGGGSEREGEGGREGERVV